MSWEILVKAGRVVDPAQGIDGVRDVAIDHGAVVALAPDLPVSESKKTIDGEGLVVTPGLINLHTHVAEHLIPIGINPDKAGVLSGVTMVCDAGGTGYANFNGLKEYVIPRARTDICCFLHLSPIGQLFLPEIGYHLIDRTEMLETVEKNRDIIKGIKIRAVEDVMTRPDEDLVRQAKSIAMEAGLPIMVHIGLKPDASIADEAVHRFTREMLSLLGDGDILTHAFTSERGGVFSPAGEALPELSEALERGVVLDVGSARSHFSLEVARMATQRDLLPTTLSTDITVRAEENPDLYSLPMLMSKYLALGLSLGQVVEMTTINPARVLDEEHRRGSLRVGMPADITLLELTETECVFSDGWAGNSVEGNLLLGPRLVIKDGKEVTPR